MQRKNTRTRSRMALWMLAGAIAGGVPLAMPAPVSAADEARDIAESKVPGQVAITARGTYLDSRDVVYRKGEGDKYVVNFTTPQNLRMQVQIGPDGRLLSGPDLAPNQPENAPRREERQRLATEWSARVRENEARRVAELQGRDPQGRDPQGRELPRSIPPIAGAPIPSQVPGTIGPDGVAAPPARAINTEVRAGDLPADVVRSLDRFTTGGRDVTYFRQRVEDRERYAAVFTDRDGARKEVIVDRTGSLMSGPLALTETVTDQMLAQDRPDQFPLATGTRVEARDLSPQASDAISRQTARATDVRYRRDTYTNGSTGYSAHWVEPESGRRFYMATSDNGTVLVPPRLSMYQPVASAGPRDAGRDPIARDRDRDLDRDRTRDRDAAERERPDRERTARPDNSVRWDDLPDSVRRTLDPITRKDRNAQYFRQTQDGRVSYGSLYKDHDGHDMWVRVSEKGSTIAGPVSAKTGQAVDHSPDRPREAQPAGARVTEDMLRDRVKFDTLPKDVQQRVLRETEGARDVTNMRHERGGRTYYHTVYTDRSGRQQELWLNDRGEPTAAPRRGD